MTARLPATICVLLAMAVFTACAQDPAISAPPAGTEPAETAETVVGAPTPMLAARLTKMPTDTPIPEPTPTPTAAVVPTPVETTLAVGLLRLADNLDDPQGYCVDVAGFGANIRLDAPLQAHTCKPGANDQLFAPLWPAENGGFRLVEYQRCLAVSEMESRATLVVSDCNIDVENQRIVLNREGHLLLASVVGSKLCVGVASGKGEPAGGRSHLRRDLALYDCDGADPSLIRWELVNR